MACLGEGDFQVLKSFTAWELFEGQMASLLTEASEIAVRHSLELPELITRWRSDLAAHKASGVRWSVPPESLSDMQPRLQNYYWDWSLGASMLCATCRLLNDSHLLSEGSEVLNAWWHRHCNADRFKGDPRYGNRKLERESEAYPLVLKHYEEMCE